MFDIAGGRGTVTFELSVKRGIPCTLIDPRPQKPKKHMIKYVRTHSIPSTVSQINELFGPELWDDSVVGLVLVVVCCG